MDELIAVYLENIQTGGQGCFEFYETAEEADAQLEKLRKDITKYGKKAEFKAVKRIVAYDKRNNRVTFN